MRFWDTSAIASLLVRDAKKGRARELRESDGEMVVWWATPVECWSALARLRREGVITPEGEDAAGTQLEALKSGWYEVLPSDEVRRHSRRLLRVHPLRAADALQLGAALVWSGGGGGEFVAFDGRLRDAARLEGFTLL